MRLLLQFKGKTTEVHADSAETVIAAAHDSLALPSDEWRLKIVAKGKQLQLGASLPALAEGAKLMVMFSAAVAIDAAVSAAPERMRGFEESDRIQRTGGLGGRASALSRAGGASSARPSSSFGFDRTEALPALQLAAGATPGPEAAQALIARLATDACLLPLLERRSWRVGLLTEMPPQVRTEAVCCISAVLYCAGWGLAPCCLTHGAAASDTYGCRATSA